MATQLTPIGPVVVYTINHRSDSFPMTVGYVFKNTKGQTRIRLNCIPVVPADWDGWLNIFPEKEKETSTPQPKAVKKQKHYSQQTHRREERDDDIPF